VDAFGEFSLAHAPALFISAPAAILAAAAAELCAVGFRPGQAGADARDNHGVLEFGEHATHLKHRPARRRRGVDRLLMQVEMAV
jgi:hypothetical protein